MILLDSSVKLTILALFKCHLGKAEHSFCLWNPQSRFDAGSDSHISATYQCKLLWVLFIISFSNRIHLSERLLGGSDKITLEVLKNWFPTLSVGNKLNPSFKEGQKAVVEKVNTALLCNFGYSTICAKTIIIIVNRNIMIALMSLHKEISAK